MVSSMCNISFEKNLDKIKRPIFVAQFFKRFKILKKLRFIGTVNNLLPTCLLTISIRATLWVTVFQESFVYSKFTSKVCIKYLFLTKNQHLLFLKTPKSNYQIIFEESLEVNTVFSR